MSKLHEPIQYLENLSFYLDEINEVGILEWVENLDKKNLIRIIKQVQKDILDDLELLILMNEDDFHRGKGKYILRDFINDYTLEE